MNIPAPNFAESASTKEKDEGLTGLMRLQEKMARKEIAHQVELTQAAVRRKSVLPKSGRDGIPVRNSGKVTSLASEKRATPMYSEGSDGIATKKEIILEETINPAAQAEFTNLESTSSRRRLAQLSINTVSPGEERVHAARQITESKTAGGWKDSEPKAGDENATDSSTQKARLGRRRSSLFRPSEM
ncbi:hypothetical protein QFC19_004820 [Naganishia cerealis]|uniref:Uncharacterized protein n=1 Tax=Naganishia cerealis TaxID=610337 RepID=A0ACC2VV04_9TREE|nr:hypothetical protein QFC19_004820 [Naganishia cerealis]